MISLHDVFVVALVLLLAGLVWLHGYCLARTDAAQPKPRHNRVACAWCGIVLKGGSEPVSHGICTACAEDQKAAIHWSVK